MIPGEKTQMDAEIGNGIGNLNAEELSKLNLRLKSQFAGEFIQMMTEAMETKCFTRCIRKPGIQSEKSDEACLVKCMDRFMESWSVVGETVAHIQSKINESQFQQKQE